MDTHFSIVIPLHGPAPYLGEALESALRPPDRPSNILLIRDDEYDDSPILKAFGRFGIRYEKVPSEGIAANWNNALESALGTYCTILHQDDRLCGAYYETIRTLFRQEPSASAAFVGAVTINAAGRRVVSIADCVKRVLRMRGPFVRLAGEPGLVSILRGNWIFCPSVCYNLTGPFPWRFDRRFTMVLDLDMYVRILMDAATIIGTHDICFEYRRHRLSTTSHLSRSLDRFREEVAFYEEIADRLAHCGFTGATVVARRRVILRLHILVAAMTAAASCRVRRALSLLGLALA